MQSLADIVENPSGWDSLSNYVGESPETLRPLMTVMTRTRDSDNLTLSNWDAALKILGGENGETVTICRFGHWACGWWEALCVTGDKIEAGQEIQNKIGNYPVLDEDDYSQRQWDMATSFWQSLTIKERIELCQKYRCKVLQARHDYIPQDDSGSLFDYLTAE